MRGSSVYMFKCNRVQYKTTRVELTYLHLLDAVNVACKGYIFYGYLI